MILFYLRFVLDISVYSGFVLDISVYSGFVLDISVYSGFGLQASTLTYFSTCPFGKLTKKVLVRLNLLVVQKN